ncbi:MAG: alpha/beta hydrolase [Myxococcales bacterium]|nr:alpha/beta hydrolase [Myxococcales bacterium]MBK7198957.1 alpha/beta hydrolase [Myxococcales bacterium]MBP6847615.1 alpha/beta hydrolase [Kofleriaceae bacterium]
MDHDVTSADGTRIHVERSGRGPTALLFVHGWLGSARWWDAQRDALADAYTIAAVDLGGHGASAARAQPSLAGYADDVVAAAAGTEAERVVLIGHSMGGAYVVAAAERVPRAAMVVLVDTLKNLDQTMAPAEVEGMLELYRRDLRTAVEQVLPRYLYAPATPPAVIERLRQEFVAVPGDVAAALVAPLYRDDFRAAARRLRLPVHAINGDLHPTDVEANRRWFADYHLHTMPGVGHYPMLERPAEFTAALRAVLTA